MVYTISTTVPYSGRTELLEITGPEGAVFVGDHSQSEPRLIWVNMVWDGTFTETITYRMKTADGGYSSETTTTTSQQINGCSACLIQGIWSTDSNDNLVSDRPIFYTAENPWQDFWNRVTALAREYFDTPRTKLVVKGQSEKVEFQAVKTADFPRIAFPEGSYYPLIEDDGSNGTTLKIKINNVIYRLKNPSFEWEAYFDFEYSSVKLLAVVDSDYNVAVLNKTDNRAAFSSKFFSRPSQTRTLYSGDEGGYYLGPTYAEYNGAELSYAQMAENVSIGSTDNHYTELAIAAEKDFSTLPTLPFEELGYFWIHFQSMSMQACIIKSNKKFVTWGNFVDHGNPGSLGNLLCLVAESRSGWGGAIRNTILFDGKIRVLKLPLDSTSPSYEDYDASSPIDVFLTIPFMAFAIKDKNSAPFETTFVDPYLANATMQGSIFDINKAILSPVQVPDQAKTQFSGDYADIVASHDGNFNSVVTAKKDCTIIAMNYSGDNATTKVVEHECNAGDTFNADMASPYSRSYPWVYLMYQNSNELPDEICFRRHQSSANVYGYFYDTHTKQADLRSGTYLGQSDVTTSKILDFDGDLLIQPVNGYVQKLDGHDTWSETYFTGFAFVYLAENSNITVNTAPYDELQIVDSNATVIDEETADENGNATLVVPTTKLGRIYTIHSNYGNDVTIKATGNMTVEINS